MLIAVFALFSWIFTFDSRDGNDEVKRGKKEQNIKIMNEDEKTRIIVYKTVNNNFLNQDTDSYGLNLYYLNDSGEKEVKYGIHSIAPCIDYVNESKRNKTLTGGNYINKNQEIFIDFLDNTSKFTVGIGCKVNLCSKVLEEEYFKERVKK